MITVKDISIEHRLLPLSFEIQAGEVVHIVGPNGSGKSTLLSALAGLIAYQGQVLLNQDDLKPYSLPQLAKVRAYLPQSARPSFNMNVFQYLALSVPSNAATAEVERVVDKVTQLLSIDDKLAKNIHHLSGGEWQRVRLAAICIQVWPTLNPDAKMVLLDEPAAALDIGQESSLFKLIRLLAEHGMSVIVANHDLNRTLQHSDKVLVLKSGVLKAQGYTKQVLTDSLVANVFETDVTRIQHDGLPHLIFS